MVRCSSATRLEDFARRWRGCGRSSVVPVLGAGVNLQAASEAGDRDDDWDSFLRRLERHRPRDSASPASRPASFIQRWECIVRAVSSSRPGLPPFRAESDLQRGVCAYLKKLEAGPARPLHKAWVDAGFRDVISLNFDRRIALHGSRRLCFVSPVGRQAVDERPLYRHDRILGAHGESRIWYPHGDSKRADTIKLGVRRYGLYIRHLEEVRARYMREMDRLARPARGRRVKAKRGSPEAWDRAVREWPGNSWACVFMSAPLLFIGCSLSADEWPLWWLLHQRARNMERLGGTARRTRPQTLVLAVGTRLPSHLQGRPANVETLLFPNYPALWAAIRSSLLG